MRRSDAHLKKGDWFIAELIGCRAEHAKCRPAHRTVTDLSEIPANDVWPLTDDTRTLPPLPPIPDAASRLAVREGIVLTHQLNRM